MRTADTFLPVARLREEMRIPEGVTQADSILQSHRASAIAWIEAHTRQPILDRYEAVFRAQVPSGQQRLEAVRRPHIRSLQAIRYWETGGESEAPDGALTGSALPRSVPLPDDTGLTIFAPPAGWPQMVAAAGIWIVVESGMAEAHRFAEAVRAAGIAFVRHRWNGLREVRPTDAMVALLAPVRDWTNGMDSFCYPDGWEPATPDDGNGVRLTYGAQGITFGGQRLRY